MMYTHKCEVKYHKVEAKVKKNGTYWANSFESSVEPLSHRHGNFGNVGFLSHLPLLLQTHFFAVDRLLVHSYRNVQLQSKKWLHGTLINLFIAKMLNGVMFFLWLNFGSKNSSKPDVGIQLLHPPWLKMVKEVASSTKQSQISFPKMLFTALSIT